MSNKEGLAADDRGQTRSRSRIVEEKIRHTELVEMRADRLPRYVLNGRSFGRSRGQADQIIVSARTRARLATPRHSCSDRSRSPGRKLSVQKTIDVRRAAHVACR